MNRLFRTRFQWFAILIFLIATAGYELFRQHSAENDMLFEGPLEICPLAKDEFYSQATYDFTAYQNKTSSSSSDLPDSAFTTQTQGGDIPWVDGEAREDVEAAIRKHAQEVSSRPVKESVEISTLRCPTAYRDRKPSKWLRVVSPENGSVFPPNLCAPYVEWEDPRNNLWQVSILTPDGKSVSFTTEQKRWRIPAALWSQLVKNPETDFTLQVRGIIHDENGERAGTIQASPEIHLSISKDPADDYIVYRSVDPPFSSMKTPNIFIRDIRKDRPELFLSSRRQYCFNCHTFSSKNGDTGKLAVQVRCMVTVQHKLPVYLSIYDFDQHKGTKVQLPFEIQMTTFMAWSPDGNQLAYSANQKIVAMKPIVFDTQLAGMATSDIAIYDVVKNETWLVPGASDPNLLEIYPQWTPDGKTLLFSRSPVGDHPAHILFDLYKMDLNTEGEPVAVPIEGASNNGKSNYFPHFSPDGKWFSFCQCDGGDLIRSSSNIYLLPADLKGPAHRLDCNVDYAADSWHSWSSNSHWIVWASKREGGIYAYLYLTHIDDTGNASPAIPLPIEERPFESFNIPEFVAHAPRVTESELFESLRAEVKPIQARLRVMEQGKTHVSEYNGKI